jgi:protein-S-isoprenylcysteine O-methyltransferase Ste14
MSSPAPPPSSALPGTPPASCPPSATLPWSALLGFAGFCAMIWATADLGLPKHVFTCLCVLATALPMLIIDLGVLKVHRRPSTGLAWGADARPGFSASRVATKLAGLGVTFGALAFVYWYAPEWSTGKHGTFFLALQWSLPVLVPVGLLYLAFVDAHMKDPEDGIYLAGAWATGKLRFADLTPAQRHELLHHALGWVIKGYYLPLMFGMYASAALGLAKAPFHTMFDSGPAFVSVVLKGTLGVDLAFGALGYLSTFRLLDAHIRSANPFVHGWVVTIMMYNPFWGAFSKGFFAYGDREDWAKVLPNNEALLWVWGGMIVATRVVWAWANALYGFRFSNLTHRGIITAGPYRLTRHPSYLFKNLSWWLSGVPFLVVSDAETALKQSLALLATNGVYLLRARAEEDHLSEDPTYVQYALWVEHHSPLRHIKRWLPFLRYRGPVDARLR